MAPRPLTEAAAVKQLTTIGKKIAKQADGAKRLALLRRQADLGDQRDAASERARQKNAQPRQRAPESASADDGSFWEGERKT
jgi:hypothetical protein